MAKGKKELDFEINLISFISLLSVLICSLLLTAIWIQIGTINVKQAVGGQSQEDTKKVPVIWAQMEAEGAITFRLQDAGSVSRKLTQAKISGLNGEVNMDAIEQHLNEVKAAVPELRTVLIQPKGDSLYENIIALMDHFKKVGMVDLGIAPL